MDRTLISILAGLGGMFGWGTSDFLANSAADKVGHFRAFFWSQVVGLVVVLTCSLFFVKTVSFTPFQFLLLLITGAAFAFGYLLFYKGFEKGNVSVVSAVINSQTLIAIAIAYFLRGQRLGLIQVPAILLILIGLILVSVKFGDLKKGTLSLVSGVKETLLAAFLFGGICWPLTEYLVENVDWLVITTLIKVVGLMFVLLAAGIMRKPLTLVRPQLKMVTLIAAIGFLEALAQISSNYGLLEGDLIIVSPISSSLTVVTVGLAMIFLKEKITRIQGLGIVLTIGGIILTAL